MSELDPEKLFAGLDLYRAWGLAVSGGPDSLALMLLAHRHALAAKSPPRLIVYSVDHGLRPQAAAEAAMVKAEAEKLGLLARVLRWEGAKPETGIQAAARAARYRLMGEAMRADGADILLTAHHLFDQAETVLMRLAHGSGLAGLRGMDRISIIDGITVVRPLLETDPGDLGRLVSAMGLEPVADPGNADPFYERVRWRLMLPMLAGLGLDARRLSRFAKRAGEADSALALAAQQGFAELATIEDGLIAIPRARFSQLPPAIAVRVLAQALGRMGNWRKPHALAAVEGLAQRLQQGVAAEAATLYGCKVRAGVKTIRIAAEAGRSRVSGAGAHGDLV